jgi:hypothetical protein
MSTISHMIATMIKQNPGIDSKRLAELLPLNDNQRITSALHYLTETGTLTRQKMKVEGRLRYVYFAKGTGAEPKQAEIPMEHVESAPVLPADIMITIPVNGKDTLTLTVAQLHHLKKQLAGIPL